MAAQPLPTFLVLTQDDAKTDPGKVLYEYLRDDIAQLEEMLDCSLDHWRPDLDPARAPDGR